MLYLGGPIPGHWVRMSRGKGQRRQEGTAGWYITALVTFLRPKGTQPVTQQVSSLSWDVSQDVWCMEKPCLREVHRMKKRIAYLLRSYLLWCLADKALNPLQFCVTQVITFTSRSGHQFSGPRVCPLIQVWNWWQPRNSSMHLLSLAAWQQLRRKIRGGCISRQAIS